MKKKISFLIMVVSILFTTFGVLGIIVTLTSLDLFGVLFYVVWSVIGVIVLRPSLNSWKRYKSSPVSAPRFDTVPILSDVDSSVSVPPNSAPETSVSPSGTTDVRPKSIKKENHKVAGTSYRQSEIKSLGSENIDFSFSKRDLEDCYSEYEKIYQLEFDPRNVELVEEPDNQHDPNAIKVIIDGVHVGYIKKGSCTHVKNLMNSNKISRITADISGGKYKELIPDDEDYDSFSLERGSIDFFVSICLELSE